jgi:hypothetical protein
MSASSDLSYGGAGDSRAGGLQLSDRFRRHADSLVAAHRSPLYARLMHAAADDLVTGGVVAELFERIPVPPGSVPQLRLLAALHELVLAGGAPNLARFYPSAGGTEPPDRTWEAAATALSENFEWIEQRLERTVQTNEPGRSAVLFAVLLWLTDRHGLPIRLLEIGASAGLNLLADRFCYVVDGEPLGDPSSPVRFDDPWRPGPEIRAHGAARSLRISARAGCDRAPLDPRDPEHQLRLVSYIWPDELERIRRLRAALELAARAPVAITSSAAADWLPEALGERREGELTVIWHSLFRQYVSPEEWAALEREVATGLESEPRRPIAWVGMEPRLDHLVGIEVTLREHPHAPALHLASCGDHGPPVIWARASRARC